MEPKKGKNYESKVTTLGIARQVVKKASDKKKVSKKK
jgi:hypothetical protein